MKLQRKERRGSRLLCRYDQPQTLFARVRACVNVAGAKVAALARVLAHTDPFALAQRIVQHLDRVAALGSRAPQLAPRARTPWRGWTFSPRVPQARALSHRNSPHTIGSGSTIAQSAKAGGRRK